MKKKSGTQNDDKYIVTGILTEKEFLFGLSFEENGLLADVSKALTEKDIDILSMNTRMSKQGIATMAVTFEISGKDELNRIIDKIRNIESVRDIERTTGQEKTWQI